jgi:hypothetical protein
MGAARVVTAENIKARVNYELRNTHQHQFTEPEILAYINKWLEFTHQFLIESASDLVRTGTGSITTEVGTEKYSLVGNNMGDLLTTHKVWVVGSEPMDQCPEDDRDAYVVADETDASGYDEPLSFYLEGDYIGFLPFPDTAYTVNFKYYPEYSPLEDIDSAMPYRNLFNLQIEEGAKILAKNRENYGTNVDAALMEIFKERAKAIVDIRRVKTIAFSPMVGGYCG